MNNKNKLQFMSYITTPLSDDSIAILYSTNNVKFDRANLYLDFILNISMNTMNINISKMKTVITLFVNGSL